MASTSTTNTCLELHIGISKHCHEPVMHKRSTQSRLSKIKPQMFRRVMLMNKCYRQEENCCRKIHHEAREAPELSCNIKMMELFPQRTVFAHASIPAKAKEKDDMLVNNSVDVTHSQPPAEQYKSQLTIFYNGAINVFDVCADKAEAIMMLAEDNTPKHTSAYDGASSITWEALQLRGSLVKNSSSAAGSSSVQNQNSEGELPIAKKLSLQRFLQKRNES